MDKEFTSELVDMLADKLLIGLSREENTMVLSEFATIDANIALLETIPNIENVEPMSWCLDRCVESLREDVAEDSIPIDDALSNCDGKTDREVEVLRVVGE